MPKRKPTPNIIEVQRRYSLDREAGRVIANFASGNGGRFKAGRFVDTYIGSTGYREMWVDGRQYKAHYIIWLIEYGAEPSGEIDHINRVRLDNRLANLRDVTSIENKWNAGPKSDNKLGIRGIDFYRGKFRVRLQANGECRNIGYFVTVEEAIDARKTAEETYYRLAH